MFNKNFRRGGRAWLIALVLKTSKGLYPSGVRIPPPPQNLDPHKTFFHERVFVFLDPCINLSILSYSTRIYIIRGHLGDTQGTLRPPPRLPVFNDLYVLKDLMFPTIVRAICVRLCIVEVSSVSAVCDFYKGMIIYFSSILFKQDC